MEDKSIVIASGNLWQAIINALVKQGLAFMLMGVAIGYFSIRDNQLEKQIQQCNVNTVTVLTGTVQTNSNALLNNTEILKQNNEWLKTNTEVLKEFINKNKNHNQQ